MTIVVGTNDCAGNDSIDNLSRKMKQVFKQAKALSPDGTVEFSSILPQTADDATQAKIEQLKSAAEQCCKDNNVTFIENDPGFRLGDGEINEGFFDDDGLKPNIAGCKKLLKQLKLQDIATLASPEPPRRWNRVTHKKQAKKPKGQQRAPCWNCGEANHTSNICRHGTRLNCNKCGKQGHKSHLCPNH